MGLNLMSRRPSRPISMGLNLMSRRPSRPIPMASRAECVERGDNGARVGLGRNVVCGLLFRTSPGETSALGHPRGLVSPALNNDGGGPVVAPDATRPDGSHH
eukprot:gene10930-17044_t